LKEQGPIYYSRGGSGGVSAESLLKIALGLCLVFGLGRLYLRHSEEMQLQSQDLKLIYKIVVFQIILVCTCLLVPRYFLKLIKKGITYQLTESEVPSNESLNYIPLTGVVILLLVLILKLAVQFSYDSAAECDNTQIKQFLTQTQCVPDEDRVEIHPTDNRGEVEIHPTHTRITPEPDEELENNVELENNSAVDELENNSAVDKLENNSAVDKSENNSAVDNLQPDDDFWGWIYSSLF
jgi:hypothetical protein